MSSHRYAGHWRPEPGPSEEQKEIDTLKQKLKLYQDNCPRPFITIFDDQGSELKDFKHKASPYRNLRSDEIDALVDELRLSAPPVEAEELKSLHSSQGLTSFGMQWIPPTDESIAKYLHKEYPAWIDETREVLWGLGTNLSLKSLIIELTISLSNKGSCPAERVKLTVKSSGHFRFLKDKIEIGSLFTAPNMPNSPRPPMGEFVNPALSGFPNTAQLARLSNIFAPDTDFLRRLRPPAPRDREAWYLDEEESESPYVTEKVFKCEHWRHQEKPFQTSFLLGFDNSLATGSAGAITFVLHAANLPEPFEMTLPVDIEVQHLDVLEEARKLLRLK